MCLQFAKEPEHRLSWIQEQGVKGVNVEVFKCKATTLGGSEMSLHPSGSIIKQRWVHMQPEATCTPWSDIHQKSLHLQRVASSSLIFKVSLQPDGNLPKPKRRQVQAEATICPRESLWSDTFVQVASKCPHVASLTKWALQSFSSFPNVASGYPRFQEASCNIFTPEATWP